MLTHLSRFALRTIPKGQSHSRFSSGIKLLNERAKAEEQRAKAAADAAAALAQQPAKERLIQYPLVP